jgi:hypothetical protein
MRARKPKQDPPAEFVEWQAATQAYVDAREADRSLKLALARARKAWLMIKDKPGFEPSPFALELMEEIMRPLQ